MIESLKPESCTLPITKTNIAWISRHALTKEQREMLRRVYGDSVATHHYRKNFRTPDECTSFVQGLIDRGFEVYLSPLPFAMEEALKDAKVEWHLFDGYQAAPGRYCSFGISRCQGYSKEALLTSVVD